MSGPIPVIIDVTSPSDGIHKILGIIRPQWIRDKIRVEVLKGGFSCYLYKCTEENSAGAVTVRVTHLMKDSPYYRKDLEKQLISHVSEYGYFPKVCAEFKNGYCYEFVEGQPLCPENSRVLMVDEPCIRLVARELANIHTIPLPYNLNASNYFRIQKDTVRKQYAEPVCPSFPTKQEMLEELDFLEDYCSTVRSPVVISHNDLHVRNIIKTGNKVVFMDWEFSRIAPRALDITYFFLSLDFFAKFCDMSMDVPEESKMIQLFCSYYAERLHELLGSESSHSPKNITNELVEEVRIFKLPCLFLWVFYQLIFYRSTKEMNKSVEEITQFNLKRYFSYKKTLLGMARLGKPY